MTNRERKNLRTISTRNLLLKYQNLFLNSIKIEGLDYGVQDYLMKKVLHGADVAAFNLKTDLDDYVMLGFGTYAAQSYDWKSDPLNIKILNERNNALVPTKFLRNNEEAVILKLGFTPNAYIAEYVDKIMDIQATIDTNLVVNKMPFIIKSTNTKTVASIVKLLDNDPFVWVEDEMFNVLPVNIPYVIDKLNLYKSETEAELLTLLGIDNVKFEKKAQMTLDEVNSNDDEIDAYRKMIRKRFEDFINQINEVLGHALSLEQDVEHEQLEEGDDDDDEVI